MSIKTPLHSALYAAGNFMYVKALKTMRGNDSPALQVPSQLMVKQAPLGGIMTPGYDRSAPYLFMPQHGRNTGLFGVPTQGTSIQGLASKGGNN